MESFEETENTPLTTWMGCCEVCGRVHALHEWSSLAFLRVETGAGIEPDSEIRRCECGREVSAPITVERLRGS